MHKRTISLIRIVRWGTRGSNEFISGTRWKWGQRGLSATKCI